MDPAAEPNQATVPAEGDGEPPIHPAARFLIAAVLAWAVNWVAGNLAFSLLRSHLLLADVVYRASAAVALIGTYALLLTVLDHAEGNWLALQGLPIGRLAGRQFVAGFAFGTALIAISIGMVAVFGKFTARVSVTPRTLRFGVEVVLLLLAGALLEEVAFRGYPFQRLVEAIGPVWAVVMLSALFAGAHLGNPNAGGILTWSFLNTLVIGVLFAVAYLRTRALWLSLGIHFGWNFTLGVLFGLPVSGMTEFAVLVKGYSSGPQWLTGGSYGLENSVTVAVLLLISFPLLLWIASATRGREGQG